jgi:uridine kinase
VKVPVYDFATHSRSKIQTQTIHGSITDVIVLEGILIFHKDSIVELMDMVFL